ncbi:hypothetical protein [Endozoicomonas sp. YOMI1]|uniref:hypothetical protein n=1 Tax=Endozoicomonas sp. YOMI1 TaxID=2828739 RepID=UPI002149434F|nr:hypothetical protein [Endozoicomonas sp. YOMI1]
MEGLPPLPSGNAPTITPSAPPNYDTVQAEMMLAGLNVEVVTLQQVLAKEFQRDSFQNRLSRVQLDISQFGVNLPTSLLEQYSEAKANLESLQEQLLGMNEMVLVKEFHGQIDGLEQSLAQKEPKTGNKYEVKALEREIQGLDKQIDKLSSAESESEKAELKERLSALTASIGEWLTVVAAFDTLKCLKSDLDGFQFQKTLQDVDSFSTKLDEFDKSIRNFPSGGPRNELMRESGSLRNSFSDIQKNVKKQHFIAELEIAEKTIKALEHEVSGNPEAYLVEQAKSALTIATPLVVLEGKDDNLAKLSNLKERLEKFEGLRVTGQTAASNMQSSVQGEVDGVITSIHELIGDADSRLSGAEKLRQAVDGIPLNQTHMDELQGILDQINEKILQVKGSDHRDERVRLQTMNAKLVARLTRLQGGGETSGQSTGVSGHPVSGNQHQTAVDNIKKALDAAEAPIEALTGNPDSSSKEDLLTQARSNLEKATQMLGTLTDQALKPERAELKTRLINLHEQLSLLETSGDQGQVNAVEPNPDVLLQQGVAAFQKEMAAFGKKGTASKAGFAVATSNMSALLSKFASSQSSSAGQTTRQTVQSSQNVPRQTVTHSPLGQNIHLQAEPVKTRPVLANGDSLASFASELGFTKTTIFDDQSICISSLGIKPSSEKIKSLVTSTDLPLEFLPFDIQERMIEAYKYGNNWPDKIKLVQVYAFAPDESDFNGASFKVELESIMPDHHREIYRRSLVRKNYSPMGANLRMPEGLKQGNRFHEAHWSLNENLARENTVSFAHGSGGDNHSSLEDIGFTLVAPVLTALGASAEVATSAEAGFGIPFGIDLKMQPQSVLNEVERWRPQRSFGFEMFDVTDCVMPDGDQLESDVASDSLGTSGINPVALHTQSRHQISTREPASEIFAKEVGILWVKTITGLPNVNSVHSLMNWVGSNKPDLPNLRLPQLL